MLWTETVVHENESFYDGHDIGDDVEDDNDDDDDSDDDDDGDDDDCKGELHEISNNNNYNIFIWICRWYWRISWTSTRRYSYYCIWNVGFSDIQLFGEVQRGRNQKV